MTVSREQVLENKRTGITWQNYEADLERGLADLHDLVQQQASLGRSYEIA